MGRAVQSAGPIDDGLLSFVWECSGRNRRSGPGAAFPNTFAVVANIPGDGAAVMGVVAR